MYNLYFLDILKLFSIIENHVGSGHLQPVLSQITILQHVIEMVENKGLGGVLKTFFD